MIYKKGDIVQIIDSDIRGVVVSVDPELPMIVDIDWEDGLHCWQPIETIEKI